MATRPQFINPFGQREHPVAQALNQLPGLLLEVQARKAQQAQQQDRLDRQMTLKAIDTLVGFGQQASGESLNQIIGVLDQYSEAAPEITQAAKAGLQARQKALNQFSDEMSELQELNSQIREGQFSRERTDTGQILSNLQKKKATALANKSAQGQALYKEAVQTEERVQALDTAFRAMGGIDVDPETAGVQFGEEFPEQYRPIVRQFEQRLKEGRFDAAMQSYNQLEALRTQGAIPTAQQDQATVAAANRVLEAMGVSEDQFRYPAGTKVSFINQTINDTVEKHGEKEPSDIVPYMNRELERIGSDERVTDDMAPKDRLLIFKNEMSKVDEEWLRIQEDINEIFPGQRQTETNEANTSLAPLYNEALKYTEKEELDAALDDFSSDAAKESFLRRYIEGQNAQ